PSREPAAADAAVQQWRPGQVRATRRIGGDRRPLRGRRAASMILNARSWGDGGPLALLVHAAVDASTTWHEVGPSLAERGSDVLAVDLRGHGTSPSAAGED